MQAIENDTSLPRAHCKSVTVCRWGPVGLLALLAGCGNIPKAQVTYYQATSAVSVKVIRTVFCDAKHFPIVATTVTPTVSHRADRDKPQTLNLDWFRGALSDADVKVVSFEDGRLQSLNASSTGQGEAILKAAATLSGTIGSLGAMAVRRTFETECKFIAAQNAGKPITIVYDGEVQVTTMDTPQVINPETTSTYLSDNVAPAIGTVCAVVKRKETSGEKPMQKPVTAEKDSGGPFLKARQPGWVDLEVRVQLPGKKCVTDDPPLLAVRAAIAQFGVDYDIPIPRPAVFGKQSVGLVFAESGALTSLQYTSATGATQALGGLSSLLTAAQGDTTAQQLAKVKAQADLIAQQQRLVECLATPKDCSK